MSLSIQTTDLINMCDKLMDGHIKYGYGAKAPSLDCDPSKIKLIDCSGFVQYVIYKVTNKEQLLPGGSWNQKEWCDKVRIPKVDYSTALESDGWLRIAFIARNGAVPGHVWLILDGTTMESHGVNKGPNRRPWDYPILKKNVWACYKLGQMFTQHRNINWRNVC